MAGKCLRPVNTGCFCRKKRHRWKKNPREEHTTEQALTSPAPSSSYGRKKCTAESIALLARRVRNCRGRPGEWPRLPGQQEGKKQGAELQDDQTPLLSMVREGSDARQHRAVWPGSMSFPSLQPDAGDLGETPVPGMGPHHTTRARSGAALPRALPGCLCSMEAAGRQSWLSAALGAEPPKHKAQHLGGTNPSVSGRVCPCQILLAEAGGAAHCATGQEQPCPTVPPSLLLPALHFNMCHPQEGTQKGPSCCLVASGRWEPEGDSGAADKNPSCGISSSPRRKKFTRATPGGAQCTPTSRARQGLGKQSPPRETPTQDPLQGAVCSVLVYGEQKEIKGTHNHPQKGKIQANNRLHGLRNQHCNK